MNIQFDKYGKTLLDMVKKKQYGQVALAILIVVFVLALQYFSTPVVETHASLSTNVLDHNYYPVKRVVDGDTFIYIKNGEDHIVRMLGSDTPETKDPRKPVQCFGKEASEVTTQVLTGKSVRLEADPTALNIDMYKRELRYVYLQDGIMINRYLIENGFAHVTRQSFFQLQQEFVNLENEARIAGKGLWAQGACN